MLRLDQMLFIVTIYTSTLNFLFNIFLPDYHKNKERPKYSVASHSSAFNNFDEESLEEGEIDPNNPGIYLQILVKLCFK